MVVGLQRLGGRGAAQERLGGAGVASGEGQAAEIGVGGAVLWILRQYGPERPGRRVVIAPRARLGPGRLRLVLAAQLHQGRRQAGPDLGLVGIQGQGGAQGGCRGVGVAEGGQGQGQVVPGQGQAGRGLGDDAERLGRGLVVAGGVVFQALPGQFGDHVGRGRGEGGHQGRRQDGHVKTPRRDAGGPSSPCYG